MLINKFEARCDILREAVKYFGKFAVRSNCSKWLSKEMRYPASVLKWRWTHAGAEQDVGAGESKLLWLSSFHSLWRNTRLHVTNIIKTSVCVAIFKEKCQNFISNFGVKKQNKKNFLIHKGCFINVGFCPLTAVCWDLSGIVNAPVIQSSEWPTLNCSL